jgi:hypothetical protein
MRFAVLSLACALTGALLLGSGCENRSNARMPAPTSTTAPAGRSPHAKLGGTAPATPSGDGLREIDGPGLIAEIRAGKRKATLLNVWAIWFWPGPVLEHEITPIITAHLAGAPLEGPTLVEPGPP